jgi:hypothetical protein
MTGVVPSGKEASDEGEQVTAIGGFPPVAVGSANVTVAVGVVTLPTRMSAGQVRAMSGMGVGRTGLPPHVVDRINKATAAPRRMLEVTSVLIVAEPARVPLNTRDLEWALRGSVDGRGFAQNNRAVCPVPHPRPQ